MIKKGEQENEQESKHLNENRCVKAFPLTKKSPQSKSYKIGKYDTEKLNKLKLNDMKIKQSIILENLNETIFS